ncbi:MAG: penicillin-binding transpeptidase domain-containing protein [Bacillota bacterium]|nr:penicillin-binding transpeptidase domain-containing protein [Bacillota bacterium]
MKSGVIPGISEPIDSLKEASIEKEKNEQTITGTIFDANNEKIAYSASVEGERQYADPYIYSSLISYSSGGLEYLYYNELYSHGKKEYKNNKDEVYYKGCDLKLTVDHELTRKAYGLIKGEPDASITVLDKDGAVKCMVSSQTFNINTIETDYNEVASKSGALMNPAKDYLVPPGSVLKPVIGETIIDYGVGNSFKVKDQGETVLKSGERIRNAGSSSYGEIGLEKALIVSSNVYFISAAEYLGSDLIDERYDELYLGKKISTDFGVISSMRTSPENEYELAMNAIGQNIGLSTVHLAMIMQGIVTGEISKPYIVDKVIQDGMIKRQGKKELFGKTSAARSSIDYMNDILTECAISYGLTNEACGIKILAKTGTAEVESESGKKNIATMLLAFPADNPQYFVAIQSRNTESWGKNLSDTAIELVKYIK